jgi:dihydrofolate reductase
MMGKVLWHVTMSVDGFIAGPGDTMDWVFGYAGPSPMGQEVIDTTGAILAGRRMYDLGLTSLKGMEPYGGAWSGPVFVLTHRPPPTGDDEPPVTFLSDGVEKAVRTGLDAAGGKNLVLFGGTVAHQALAQGLVDEIVIHLAPVLLGDGVRLVDGAWADRIDLDRVELAEHGQVTDLRFRVLK